jgi:hypothetical protein
MGIHELTKENMREIWCVCGEPAEVEILGYNDRQTVDMRVTCTKRSCAAHDRPYLMRNVHSASLIKDFIPEHKATCAECNWEGFSSQLY